MSHAWERRGKCTGFGRESQKERDHLENRDVEGRMGSEWILVRLAGEVYSEYSWLRTVVGGGLL
jgi:hypothetical protein